MKRERADELLVRSGLATELIRARALIMAGAVLWTDARGREAKVKTPGQALPAESTFRLKGQTRAFVARSGHKLDAALDAFEIEVAGRVALDAGLSTGGFTDCLLRRGAARVHGVDVAYGIVDLALRNDPRLRLYERTNVRHLKPNDLGESVDVVTADLSFIRLTPLLPGLLELAGANALFILLVKPQFELDRDEVDGGIVTDDIARQRAADRVERRGRELGLSVWGRTDAAISGAKGNREIVLVMGRGDPARFKRANQE